MDGTEDIFDRDFLSDALQSARQLVDSGTKFRRLVGDTFSKFNDDLMSNTRAITKLFDDIHADQDKFEKFDIKRGQAEYKLNQILHQREKAFERLNEIQSKVLPDLKDQLSVSKENYKNAVLESNLTKTQLTDKRNLLKLVTQLTEAAGKDVDSDKTVKALRREYLELTKQKTIKDSIVKGARRDYNNSRIQVNATEEVSKNLRGNIRTLTTLERQTTGYVDKWKQASRQLGWIEASMKAISKIPGLNELFNAEEVLENMRKATLNGKGFFASVKAGLSALPKNIPWLLAVDLAVKALTKLFNLWVGSDKFLTRISRQYNVIKDDAEGILTSYRKLIPSMQTQYATLENILSAQEELNDLSLRSFYHSKEVIDAQIQLTKEYNLTGDAALNLSKQLMLNNEAGTAGLDNVRATVKQYMATNRVIVNTERILKKVADITGEMRQRFKGSVAEMTKAVLQADKLGISLNQAKSAASGLLDFQSSIENELEAELLLNKSLNFERARMMALNRDYLGAAEDILSQLGDYDALAKMNAVQLNAAAKAAGMTADELVEAAAQQKYLTGQAKQFHDQLDRNSSEAENFRKLLVMNDGDFDKTTRQITAQEKLAVAMQHVEDLFTSFVADGTLDKLASTIERIANGFVRIFGEDNNLVLKQTTKEISDLNAELGNTTDMTKRLAIQEKINDAMERQQEAAAKNTTLGRHIEDYGTGVTGFMRAGLSKLFNPKQDDFISRGNTITPFRKDDLVIAGTNLLGQQSQSNSDNNELLSVMKELLSTVKAGGKVVMDGRQVGYTQLMGTYNSA